MNYGAIVILSLCLVFLSLVMTSFSDSLASESNASNTNDNTASTIEKLNVVTPTSPITNIVKNVGGDRIDLTSSGRSQLTHIWACAFGCYEGRPCNYRWAWP